MHRIAKCFNNCELILLYIFNLVGMVIKKIFSSLDDVLLSNGRFQKTLKAFAILGFLLGLIIMTIYMIKNTEVTRENFFAIFLDFSLFFNVITLFIGSGVCWSIISLILFFLLFTFIKITKDNQADVFIITSSILIIATIIVIIFDNELNTSFVISLGISSYLVAIVDLVRDNYDENSLIYKFRNLPLYIMLILSIYLLIKNPESFSIGYINFNDLNINAIALGSIGLVFAGIGLRRINK